MNLLWPETRSTPPLEAGEVHVWAVPLSGTRTAAPEINHILSDDERARAGRFLRAESGRSFAVGRAALRSILGNYLQMSPSEVPIENAPNGKPQLAGAIDAELKFNLAHSGELALVAVTRGGEIGVDVECMRPVDHWHEIASRYFHSAEAAVIGANAAQTPTNFFRCWTRKEAVLKAIGVGIIFPLDLFRVPLDDRVESWIDVPANSSNAPSRYWLASIDPCGDYIAAVAATNQISSIQGFTHRI